MILNVNNELNQYYSANWFRVLSRWSMLTGIVYLFLFLGIFVFVLPASQNSSLPKEYFELAAAINSPFLYQLTITFDLAVWLMEIGFFIILATLLIKRFAIHSTFIAVSAIGMVTGFFGACLRLDGTIEIASAYTAASTGQQASLIHSYQDMLRLINTLFNAGGLMGSIAMLLFVYIARSTKEFPRWVLVLIGITGFLHLFKVMGELYTKFDFGPLALLAGILFIIALFAIARKHWRSQKIDYSIAESNR